MISDDFEFFFIIDELELLGQAILWGDVALFGATRQENSHQSRQTNIQSMKLL